MTSHIQTQREGGGAPTQPRQRRTSKANTHSLHTEERGTTTMKTRRWLRAPLYFWIWLWIAFVLISSGRLGGILFYLVFPFLAWLDGCHYPLIVDWGSLLVLFRWLCPPPHLSSWSWLCGLVLVPCLCLWAIPPCMCLVREPPRIL